VTFPYAIVFQSEHNFEDDGLKILNCKPDDGIMQAAEAQETMILDADSFTVRISSGDQFKETACEINPYCHTSHIVEPVKSDGIFLFTVPYPLSVIIDIFIAVIPLVILVGYRTWQKSKRTIFSLNKSLNTITVLKKPYTKTKGNYRLRFSDVVAMTIGIVYALGQHIYKWMLWN
jgi:hypothetical protein